MMKPLFSKKVSPLQGTIQPPGDKSLSHRALIMATLAIGESRISGLLEGEDVLNTARAMAAMGADIKRDGADWIVHGVGIGGLTAPQKALDMGNSGTGARLIMGMVSVYPQQTCFIGDESLSSRPMKRVTDPLTLFGADFEGADGMTLPLTVKGTQEAVPITYRMTVASAQVKSAILLAALNVPGRTTVVETVPTRDHTERLFQYFKVPITITRDGEDRQITVTGQPDIGARDMIIPGDPSSAAFPTVAALITPGSDITIENVGINPLRTGLYTSLKEMGGAIDFINLRENCGEPVADIRVRHSRLSGITVPKNRAPSMIDEYPILAVAASFARGETVLRGLSELRVKESDRIAVMAAGLKACGVAVTEHEDGMTIPGQDQSLDKTLIPGGCAISTHLDHRIAMAFLTLGLQSEKPVEIDDGRVIETSFPGFQAMMNRLGARIDSTPS